jgi:hypothetical protein
LTLLPGPRYSLGMTGRARRVLTLLGFAGSLAATLVLPARAEVAFKPYRVLLVIADQWKDPTGTLIADGGEFQEMVTLLKSWGVPFDILRLDQERLSLRRFLAESGAPRYGAVLWDADQTRPILEQDYGTLTRAVRDHHISLIAIGDRIREPVIQELLGLKYRTVHPHSSDLKIAAQDFLTRGLPDPLDEGDGPSAFKQRVQVEVGPARVLVRQGDFAQVTVRDIHPDTRAIWIGGDAAKMFSYQAVRTLLRRAVAEAIGYSLIKTWKDHIILMMDDLGSAQSAWLEHWHYPALTADEIRRYLIGPLKEHNAVLVVNALPGFVDDRTRRIEPSWRQDFVDAFGVRQNTRSTKEGLDEGIKAGVIEIHSHGWTHMQPDLDSPPGPWWGSPLDGERAEVGWYREFYDVRRGAEIPAAVQMEHLVRSKEWLRDQFGTEPLSFATGGNGVSTSFTNNTWRLGARAGFGWYGGYLGEDLAVQGNANATAPFGGTDDVPLILPAPPDGHDRGITMDPGAFAAVFDAHPGARFMGLDEYIGYLHAAITAPGGLSDIEVADHPRFGRYFKTHDAAWDLHLSDWLRDQLPQANARLEVDGQARPLTRAELIAIKLPAGRPIHHIRIVTGTKKNG